MRDVHGPGNEWDWIVIYIVLSIIFLPFLAVGILIE